MAEYISFQPSDFYNTKLYTGTGASNAQTGVGFQPDFTWIKNRAATDSHIATDAVRGATKYLVPNDSTAETTNVESLKSFDSDGYTLGTMNEVNTNTELYVGWNWKMGTTSGITTDGGTTITPSGYSFNATAGQSIIAYTGNGSAGAKIPHGLGTAPQYISIHRLDNTSAWDVFHHQQQITSPEDYYLDWTSTAASAINTTRFGGSPDAVNFTVGNSDYVNGNTYTYVAYCWTPKKGYSKFGGYTGNGNADGPFLYTGFKPAYVMTKRVDSTGDWYMWDDKRLGYNPDNNELYTNNTDAEATSDRVDLLSNGFKLRNDGAGVNANGGRWIYAAFAEFPIVSSNDTPGVAR